LRLAKPKLANRKARLRRRLRRGSLRRFASEGWWGLAAPKGTPPEIVAKLNQEFVRLFRDPKFIAYLETQSVVAAPTTPEEFVTFIKDDRKAAEKLIGLARTPKTEYKE